MKKREQNNKMIKDFIEHGKYLVGSSDKLLDVWRFQVSI